MTQRLPKILYHYTTAAGMHGILKSKEIWTSHVLSLNDYAEISYPARTMKKTIEEMISRRSNSSTHRKRLTMMRDGISFFIQWEFANHYVACFSSERDSLGQWRGYGDQRCGFALGFCRKELKRLAEQNKFELSQCEYGEAQLKRALTDVIEKALRRQVSDSNPWGLFKHELAPLFSNFKGLGFKDEKEYRLSSPFIFFARHGLVPDVMPKGSMVVPIHKFLLTDPPMKDRGASIPYEIDFPLKEIVIGPNPHPDNHMKSLVKTACQAYGLRPDSIKITCSDITYRSR